MRWARNVAQMREMREAYKVLAGRAEGKRSFAIPRHRQEDGRVRTGFIWLL
jgi:hypothetical protein